MMTTMTAIVSVAASSKSNFPASVAWLRIAPSPRVESVCPLKRKYSAIMLAFQAPPANKTAKAESSGNLLQIARNRHSPSDDVKEQIPLRAENHEQNGCGVHAAPSTNEKQQNDRKESSSRHRGGNLSQRLCEAGQPPA